MDMGIVMIQAQSNFLVTPQRTADTLFRNPTPIMAPVMVCVVLTGIPSSAVENKVIAPAVSAANPSKGVKCVMRCPMVFTILHPPIIVPTAMAAWQESTTQKGMSSVFAR